jgi:hypothetical protein
VPIAVVPNQRWWTREFALRITQPVDRQQFNHLRPLHRAAPLVQGFGKERVQPQFLPEPAAQPAGAKLPGMSHRQPREDHFAHVGRVGRSRAFPVGEKPVLPTLAFVLDHLNRALPTLKLRGVEFP